MAGWKISKSGFPMKATLFKALGLLCFTLFVQKSCATEFIVGGSKGWTVPTDNNEPHYNQWAEKTRFQIGDSLVFVYPAGKDSVFLVSYEDYVSCNIDNPQKKYDDGHTTFKFDRSGPHYFVSGNRENCLKNEKVAVVVLADRSNRANAASPPPPPSSAGTTPSPAPSGEESPSPPGGIEVNPSPSPTSETLPTPPPPSDAPNVHISFLGYLGAFVASSLVLVF